MIIGGDHSITYPILSAYNKFFPKINIVHFDAHPDLYENFKDNPFSHASPFARIMENNLAKSLTQIGIRTMNDHQEQQATIYGVNVIPMNRFSTDIELKVVSILSDKSFFSILIFCLLYTSDAADE